MVRDMIYLPIPPIKKFRGSVPGFQRLVSFEIVNNVVIEFLVVEVIVNAAPLARVLESEVELHILVRNAVSTG